MSLPSDLICISTSRRSNFKVVTQSLETFYFSPSKVEATFGLCLVSTFHCRSQYIGENSLSKRSSNYRSVPNNLYFFLLKSEIRVSFSCFKYDCSSVTTDNQQKWWKIQFILVDYSFLAIEFFLTALKIRTGDVQATARVQGIEEVRDGVRYMRIGRLLVDFRLERARFRVADELNGNNVIGQAMNQFLNQNAQEIIKEMRPAASSSIAKHFMSFLNTAFTKVPLKVWLHDT